MKSTSEHLFNFHFQITIHPSSSSFYFITYAHMPHAELASEALAFDFHDDILGTAVLRFYEKLSSILFCLWLNNELKMCYGPRHRLEFTLSFAMYYYYQFNFKSFRWILYKKLYFAQSKLKETEFRFGWVFTVHCSRDTNTVVYKIIKIKKINTCVERTIIIKHQIKYSHFGSAAENGTLSFSSNFIEKFTFA